MIVNETNGVESDLKGALDDGLRVVSGGQEVTFKKYNRMVLPIDGYVFWVLDTTTPDLIVRGSFHHDTDQQQRTDETIGLNRVVFTTQDQVQSFNSVAANTVYIGSFEDIRFAFTAQGKKYQNAGTYHYRGDAIYPPMQTQIIDNPGAPVNLGGMIATNSMPIWLSLNRYMPLYPSNLVPSNIPAPYGAVEITDTEALQAAPLIDVNSNHAQLLTEKVKIIMYGLRNDQALAFLNYVGDYTITAETMGIQNMPAVVDDKRGQSELGILAQKKYIEFHVDYYQASVVSVARKLITAANVDLGAREYLLDANFQPFVLDQSLVA
jgi:hypothetical protein